MLWNTLNLFFTSMSNDGHSSTGEPGPGTGFPQGQLTSAAWEGWFDNHAQA
jgi:hypothetical protein